MDIFAHGLWSAAAAVGGRRKLRRKVNAGWTAWWGVFPDLFAFTLPFAMMTWRRFTDPSAASLHAAHHSGPNFALAWQLYQISHSLIVFACVFALVWFIAKRPIFELLGWPLHILIDIPTHTRRFFATPFLWPVSSYQFSGISWGNRWFMLCNYSALAIVYIVIWWTRRRAAEPVVEIGSGAVRE